MSDDAFNRWFESCKGNFNSFVGGNGHYPVTKEAWKAALDWKKSQCKCDESVGYFCESCMKEITLLNIEREKVEILSKALSYNANTEIYRRPDRDRNGMGGMSAMTDFEIDDGEWKLDDNGEKDHYCYGKLARKVLNEVH